MGQRALSGRPPVGGGAPGFTFIETMVAMAMAMIVLLANIFLINTAHRNMARAKVLTDATNLAADTLAALRTRTLAEVNATTDGIASGFVVGTHVDDAVQEPLSPADAANLVRRQQVGTTVFTRTWTVSNVDSDADGVADLVGDIVKVRVDVAWAAGGRDHHVTMATLTTGRAP